MGADCRAVFVGWARLWQIPGAAGDRRDGGRRRLRFLCSAGHGHLPHVLRKSGLCARWGCRKVRRNIVD